MGRPEVQASRTYHAVGSAGLAAIDASRSSSLRQMASACFREHAARQPIMVAAPASHQP